MCVPRRAQLFEAKLGYRLPIASIHRNLAGLRAMTNVALLFGECWSSCRRSLRDAAVCRCCVRALHVALFAFHKAHIDTFSVQVQWALLRMQGVTFLRYLFFLYAQIWDPFAIRLESHLV